jgi:hypothetical protein
MAELESSEPPLLELEVGRRELEASGDTRARPCTDRRHPRLPLNMSVVAEPVGEVRPDLPLIISTHRDGEQRPCSSRPAAVEEAGAEGG